MIPEEIPAVLSPAQIKAAHAWWNSLSDPWKQAFNEVLVRQTTTEIPDDRMLFTMQHLEVVRLAGPRAPFSNMTFELGDLSGLRDLPDLKIVIVIFHQLVSLKEISHVIGIQSLFVLNNQLPSIEGIEKLENLKEFYFSGNQVDTLRPLAQLTQLHTVYCNYNKLHSLEGIGNQHISQLKQFVCLPNDVLPDAEIIRMEREIGIRCLKG